MTTITLSTDQLQRLRAARYRQTPASRLRTEAEGLGFINDVGMCLLFSAKDVELPSLWGALCGEDRALPAHHDNYELGLAWDWKDTIPARGEALYGKFIKHKPVFLSLELGPHFYALSGNYGELEDYLEEYREGRLSEEARRIYEALLEHGPLDSGELRRKAGLASNTASGLFDRAVADLQMGFKVAKAGVAAVGRWKYAYVYDLFLRRFPAIAAAARDISQDRAAATILECYVRTVVATRPADVRRLFGWDAWRAERTVSQLTAAGRLRADLRLDDAADAYLALTVGPAFRAGDMS
jgi:hypothetical protein